MPANRPGRVAYVTHSGADIQHGQAVKSGRFVGTAIKQAAPGWDSLVAAETAIVAGEQYAITVKGKVLVDNVSGFAKGDPVYITSGNALTETSTSNTKFGVVTEAPADRGTPAGKCWVDLDLKSSF